MLEFHELANIFPLIEGDEFKELVADIAEQGLHSPVVLFQGKILDGRNRYRGCIEAKVEPIFEDYVGNDPVGYVISLNLKRRHLNESQRAMVAAKLATLSHGGDRSKSPIGDLTQQQAADLLNVGKRCVERATEVRDHGATELQQAVERGQVSVSAAADVATLPEQEQQEIVARGEREILQTAKAIRARKANERRSERLGKLTTISQGSAELPSDRKYPLLYVDPPWPYHVYDGEIGTQYGAAENHYPLMSMEDICKLPVQDIATSSALLFMWVTGSHLGVALQQVLPAWEFEYVTNVAWVKQSARLGYWVRNQHELLIIARRGDMPTPVPGNKSPSVIQAPRREHSRKPDEAYELIERMYPDLPKIELFARQARAGWAVWGNQAPVEAAQAA